MTSPDVEAIVKRLTKAQRAGLLHLGAEWTLRTGQGHGHHRMLYFLGLAETRRVPDARPEAIQASRRAGVQHRLRPLGQQVRAHILSQEQSR